MARLFDITSQPLVAATWTPITGAPIQASRVVIQNMGGVDMLFRVEENGAQKVIPSLQELNILTGGDASVPVGMVMGSVYVASGTGPVTVSYTR